MPFSSSICLGEGFLALRLRLGAELVHLGDELEPRAIGLEERVEVLGRPLAGERRPPGVRIGPRSLDVDHARESRRASMTWLTPSSCTGGQTKSATARTRSWALATATA